MTNTYYTILPDRSALCITGDDVTGYLQGFLTQDMKLLDTQKLTYSALLTAQGKLDYDFFIFKQGDMVILECETGRVESLRQRLSMFRLRRNIELNIVPVQVVALWGDNDVLKAFSYPTDPRHTALGLRNITFQPIDKSEYLSAVQVEFNFYDRLRLEAGVPDGSRDISWGEDTVADVGLEKFNAISFTKGCYLGQELTSRMHHRGLGKRGLYPVSITGAALPPFTDLLADGNLIGEMRSSNGHMGLAMLRHDSLKIAFKTGVRVLGAEEDDISVSH